MWLLGRMFGYSVTQDIAGTLLFDVKDKGYERQPHWQLASPEPLPRAASIPTTPSDPAAPDLVCLLCLRPAVKGGEYQLISAITLHNHLITNNYNFMPH